MFLRIVVLNDVAHRPNGREVLVNALRADVMQGLRRSRISVRAGEVDSHLWEKHGGMKRVHVR